MPRAGFDTIAAVGRFAIPHEVLDTAEIQESIRMSGVPADNKFQRPIWFASSLSITRPAHRSSLPTVAGTPDILMVSQSGRASWVRADPENRQQLARWGEWPRCDCDTGHSTLAATRLEVFANRTCAQITSRLEEQEVRDS